MYHEAQSFFDSSIEGYFIFFFFFFCELLIRWLKDNCKFSGFFVSFVCGETKMYQYKKYNIV